MTVDPALVDALIRVATTVEGHTVTAYGQSSYDGDFCRSCAWQGPPSSGADHRAATRRAALTEAFTGLLLAADTQPDGPDDTSGGIA